MVDEWTECFLNIDVYVDVRHIANTTFNTRTTIPVKMTGFTIWF